MADFVKGLEPAAGLSLPGGGISGNTIFPDANNAWQQGVGGAISAVQQWGGGPNWGGINQQAFNDVNNPAFAGIF